MPLNLAPQKEEELIRRVIAKDEEAAALLISAHEQRVYNLSLRMTKNPQDAADLMQEIFIHLLNKINSFRFESSFASLTKNSFRLIAGKLPAFRLDFAQGH